MRLYTIYDKKAAQYGEPLMQVNDAVMVRALRDALSRSESPLSKYPEDYDLYSVGEFDQDTARIDSESPQFVCNLTVALGKE